MIQNVYNTINIKNLIPMPNMIRIRNTAFSKGFCIQYKDH